MGDLTEKDIKTIPIFDRHGKLIGNITGRKGDIDRYQNRDLAHQLEVDRKRHRENLERK